MAMGGRGFGILGNIVVGVIGALLSGFVGSTLFGWDVTGFNVGASGGSVAPRVGDYRSHVASLDRGLFQTWPRLWGFPSVLVKTVTMVSTIWSDAKRARTLATSLLPLSRDLQCRDVLVTEKPTTPPARIRRPARQSLQTPLGVRGAPPGTRGSCTKPARTRVSRT